MGRAQRAELERWKLEAAAQTAELRFLKAQLAFGGPDDFEIGMALELDLETLRTDDDGDEVVIFRFRPAGADGGRS